tara:strand:- start:69 stop:683 length:615 start_codon:yes stop_codon:yes gene_type:complete
MTIDNKPVFSDIQGVAPSAIIELFELKLDNSLHGATTTYRFHAGINLKEDIVNPEDADIIWNSQTYQRIPVTAEGFAYQKGQLPRPKLIVSNIQGTMSAILLLVNKVTSGNDLMGATVTRIRTLARFLDAANFAPIGSNPPANPFGTPDPDAEFPREIYTIDRKANENRDVVEFELAAAFDLVGVRAPKRQCTRELFPSLGSFV